MNALADLFPDSVALASPFPNVSSEKWTEFVRVMMTAPSASVSASNALGAFEMMPRRLVDLGILKHDLKRVRSETSKRVIWAAVSGPDHERARAFLKSLPLQFRTFMCSMKDYYLTIEKNAVKLPQDCTLSGALALLHRAGLAGLSGSRFPATQLVFERANGIF